MECLYYYCDVSFMILLYKLHLILVKHLRLIC